MLMLLMLVFYALMFTRYSGGLNLFAVWDANSEKITEKYEVPSEYPSN
jgi:hypothetical protein